MIGKTLGHYRVVEKIGAGGMGEVYRAHDEQLDRDVAVKVLPASSFADPSARARLLREARTASKLNHPHICTIHEVGEADGQAYIAMELVEGRPLSERVAGGPLPVEQVLRYGQQVADALAHAHERGVVHRDLKSANVVITPEGRAKVLDFGLAKQLREEELETVTRSQASLTAEGAVMGTLAYMAPEQLRGQPPDARSDVWALGVVLHEMLAGQRPFQGRSGYELSAAILREDPGPLPAKVPVTIQAVVERCLAKEPGERYQRASEVRAALEAVATGAVAPWVGLRYALRRRRALAAAVAVVVLVAAAVAANLGGLRERLFGIGAPKIESIAVLPLENLSGDPEQDYFADGMTEALISNLAQIRSLKIISRTSVMQYKKTKKRVPVIVSELGVDGVIEGSVQRTGTTVRISVQLINGTTDALVWSGEYWGDGTDVLKIQAGMARDISSNIRAQLTPQEELRLREAAPVDPEAHDAYLRGRYYRDKGEREDLEKARQSFEQALEKDPNHAPAYAGLADYYSVLPFYTQATPQEVSPKARAAVSKALELNDSQAEAHATLAYLYTYFDWDWVRAETEFQRALELNPNDASLRHRYSRYLSSLGRIDEALEQMRRARELDPLSLIIKANVGVVYYFGGQYDRAIEELRRVLQEKPDFSVAHWGLGLAFEQKGMHAEALAEFEKAVELSRRGTNSLASLGHAYAVAGKVGEARAVLKELRGRSTSAYQVALVHVGLREKEEAFAALERALQQRSTLLTYLKMDPRFRSLHPDPRFQALLRRMNFPN